MKKIAAVIPVALVFILFGICVIAAASIGPEDLPAELDNIAKTEGVAVKMDAAVASVALGITKTEAEAKAFAPDALDFVDGKARVVLELANEGKKAALSPKLERLGCVVETSYKNLVQALVPPERLKDVAALDEVLYVRAPLKPCLPTVTSEGVPMINADDLHALGVTGSGVKVAIIDLGFEGYATNPELPASCIAEVKSFRADHDIEAGEVHGTACAEIIHDVAPSAQLYLFNFGTDVEYANAVAYAISKGVDIISASLGWVNAGPYDGTGYICDIANDARAHGILYVNAAGNQAEKHYEGTFTDADSDGWHEFATPDETIDLGYLPAGTPVTLYLSWDDWPYSNQDYDLYLLVETPYGLAVAAKSANLQTGTQPPTEAIVGTLLVSGNFHVAIKKYQATRNVHFELYSFTNDFPEYDVPESSLCIPADAEGVLTVGAVYWQTGVLEDFSSRGPTNDGRTKPDVVAPDGVSTFAYGAGNFYGTSAATPHVAGAAALLKSAYPTLTADDLQYYLENTAIDLGVPGKDNNYGAGLIDVLAAYDAISGPTTPTVSIWTNEPSYTAGDVMNVGLSVTNPLATPYNCRFAVWLQMPTGGIVVVINTLVTLPSGLNYNNPAFLSFTLPPLPSGSYTWHAAIIDPATGSFVAHDTATWTFA